MQKKRSNEKLTRRKINLQITKRFFFLWTPPTFKPHTCLISYSFQTIKNAIGAPSEVLQIMMEL